MRIEKNMIYLSQKYNIFVFRGDIVITIQKYQGAKNIRTFFGEKKVLNFLRGPFLHIFVFIYMDVCMWYYRVVK